MKTFSYKKSVQALNLFTTLEGGTLNYTKAIKLVWLSDRYFLRNHGRTITGDEYFALKNGPLASCTSDLIKAKNISSEELQYRNLFLDKKGYSIVSIKNPDINVFAKKEVEVLEKIYKSFSHLTWHAISDFSHMFPEWKVYEDKLNEDKNRRYKIDMELFFGNVNEPSGLYINSKEELDDLKAYHKEFYSHFCYA
jgi:hypothetical protein